MKFSYAIFDMDGLMFDTENLFVRAFEEAIGPEIGYRFSREKMKQLIGLNHQAALETFPRLFPGCPAPCEACLTRFRAWMQEYIRENGTRSINTTQTMRTHASFRLAKIEAVVPTMFCVWPEGKE